MQTTKHNVNRPSFATIPENFDWKIVKMIANNQTIQNEESARIYFRRFAHNNSDLRNKYFREKLNIPKDFDEEIYIDYLKNNYNVKLTNGNILNESLYLFFNVKGKKNYPLDAGYYKIYYDIPKDFDEILYKKSYEYNNNDFLKELNNAKNVYEFFKNNEKKYPLNQFYLKIYYNLPDKFNINIYREANKTIFSNKTSDVDIVRYYNKNKDSLDDKYYKLFYNIPNNFEESTYYKRYENECHILKSLKHNLNDYYITLKNMLLVNQLDDIYYRIYYNVSEDVNVEEYRKTILNNDKSISYEELYKIISKRINASAANVSAANVSAATVSAATVSAANVSAATVSAANVSAGNASPVNVSAATASPVNVSESVHNELHINIADLDIETIPIVNEKLTIEKTVCENLPAETAILNKKKKYILSNNDLLILFPGESEKNIDTFYLNEISRCTDEYLKKISHDSDNHLIYLNNFVLDNEDIEWNNVMKVNFLEKKIKLEKIYDVYSELKHKGDSIIKFINNYIMIKDISYLKVKLNYEYYFPIFYIYPQIKDIVKMNDISQPEMLITISNEYISLYKLYLDQYDITIEFNKRDLKKYSTCKLNVLCYQLNDNNLNKIINMKNILFLEELVNRCNVEITITTEKIPENLGKELEVHNNYDLVISSDIVLIMLGIKEVDNNSIFINNSKINNLGCIKIY